MIVRFVQSLKILPRWIILLIDLSILFFSLLLAYLLRFNFNITDFMDQDFFYAILLYIGCNLLAIFITQSYAGIIRHTSLQDGMRIVYTATVGVILAGFLNIGLFYALERNIIPLSVIIISYFNSVIFLFSYRLLVKYVFTYYSNAVHKRKHAVIYGAGQSGLITQQIIGQDRNSNLKVVGFLEDDRRKAGKVVNGVKIYDAHNFVELVQNLRVHEFIISIQNLSLKRKNEIVDLCLKAGIKVRHVPPTDKWIKGELSVNQIREINIEDLLGRESIKLNNPVVRNELTGKCILITGAAGSIGSEIVRQILTYKPAAVVMVDQSETGLYDINNDVQKLNKKSEIVCHVADVSNYARMDYIFSKYNPDIVFHAAAYKHVPMMEKNPSEAVICNIGGTKNLADLSVKYQVTKFVMISTDKAVNPTNVMGASKRIAEIYVQSLNAYLKKKNPESTCFITTRFGNVLGSNGSVIPLFKKQIQNREPLTVTHPDITRYFMTIPEACQLVLEAGAMGKGGEIFIFDMGRSVKIVDLAYKMIRLSGLQPEKDIQIQFTGLREGEKLYEELLSSKDNTIPTHHSKILKAKVQPENYLDVKKNIIDLIDGAIERKDDFHLVGLMKFIVPEYISNYSRFEVLDNKEMKNAI